MTRTHIILLKDGFIHLRFEVHHLYHHLGREELSGVCLDFPWAQPHQLSVLFSAKASPMVQLLPPEVKQSLVSLLHPSDFIIMPNEPCRWANLPNPSLPTLYLIPGVGVPKRMQPALFPLPACSSHLPVWESPILFSSTLESLLSEPLGTSWRDRGCFPLRGEISDGCECFCITLATNCSLHSHGVFTCLYRSLVGNEDCH